jgi:hypothetical protein
VDSYSTPQRVLNCQLPVLLPLALAAQLVAALLRGTAEKLPGASKADTLQQGE